MSIRQFAVTLVAVPMLFGFSAVRADDAVNASKETQHPHADELRQILRQILTKLDSVDLRLRQLEKRLDRHGAVSETPETHQRVSKQQIEDILRRDPVYSHAAHALDTRLSTSEAEIWLLKKQLEQRRQELTPMIIRHIERSDAKKDTHQPDSDD